MADAAPSTPLLPLLARLALNPPVLAPRWTRTGRALRRWSLALAQLAPLALAACAAVGPDYREPAQWVAGGTASSEAGALRPHGGSLPALTGWWQQFNDPVLTRLQQAAEADSPTLAAAWGAVEQARATLASAQAGTAPTLTGSASLTRARQQGTAATTTRAASLDAAWELDLVGKLRRGVESAQAQLAARQGDWHDARVSLAAEVATDYVEYRACGALAAVYEQELTSLTQTTAATESLVRAGLSPATDAAMAQASQASTASSLLSQRAQCEQLVKTLTQLSGLDEAALRALLASGSAALPVTAGLAVTSVPAQALRQRPDIAARERDLAAASASIGVAEAKLYPSLQLGGSLGLSVAGGSSLSSWSLGPSLSLPLLDGGSRRAAVDSARASYEVAYAQWRDAVRSAVAEVEKALVQLDAAGQRVTQSERAAQAYRDYLVGAESQRRAGTISLLSFEEARRQALAAQLDLLGLQRDRVTQWIALYKALGGGWDRQDAVAAPLSRAP